MHQSQSLLETKSLEHCTLKVLLDALASDAMIPGAGAASGVALALAAACAGKAVAITRRHGDDPDLVELQQQLAELRESGLALGETDALLFKQFLESGGPEPEGKLLRTDCRILDNCRALESLLARHEHRIAENMSGDWQAARVLSRASRLIQETNVKALGNEREK